MQDPYSLPCRHNTVLSSRDRPLRRLDRAAPPSATAAFGMPRRGRVPGVENYSPEDVKRLLEIIGAVLPTGANEWEVVLHNYEDSANKFDRAERELTSLKKKFSGLLNVKKPTGAW
ncbi:hypothetical protein L915_16945 [Phytophthora nicotianae]|uniref:DUF6818 domain-containing protein n=2 Tax=Phytophthora nicotianae TaxID=4792 RepID=W2G345_PHYNI|nr:hypothetical protein L915_16945 [Phytophthora nicotianae]